MIAPQVATGDAAVVVSHSDEPVVQWLRQPAAYPHNPGSVEVRETHISWVFLAGDLVYKLKKPVRYNFLDFSSVELREQACREEVRLNRRLAPSVYLDVVPITQSQSGALRLGGKGTAIDWCVEMRRLPTDRTLDVLLRRGKLQIAHVDHLAEILADFYQKLAPLPIAAEEYRSRCLAHVHDNRRELLAVSHHLQANVVKRIHATQLQLIWLHAVPFDKRVADGRIVEGHGDLRPEHVCFTEPPVVFDCIEFNEEFRRLDVADDLAFLISECDYLGSTWVGDRLAKRFHVLTGDQPPTMLWAFYKSYRACVRAKVAALRRSSCGLAPTTRDFQRDGIFGSRGRLSSLLGAAARHPRGRSFRNGEDDVGH